MSYFGAGGHLDALLRKLAAESAVLVSVQATQGSVPRMAGAWMAVFPDLLIGSIGGGHLEYMATQRARLLLQQVGCGAHGVFMRVPLGPSLGQCCGGVVQLKFEAITAAMRTALVLRLQPLLTPVALFGGGHVGHALVRVLVDLPFSLRWIDSRDGIFPPALAAQVVCEHCDPVQAAVHDLAPGSRVLIMTFSHTEDLEVLAACLQRCRAKGDLPYIGLIGSRSKWASFSHRLQARGFTATELSQVTSPIGLPGIQGKEPEVIAIAVAAQLLQTRNAGPTPNALGS